MNSIQSDHQSKESVKIMRRRCLCGKIASTKRACRSCGSPYPMWHCHDRAHRTHTLRGMALGYENEDLGPCEVGHVHAYDDTDHLNQPVHDGRRTVNQEAGGEG